MTKLCHKKSKSLHLDFCLGKCHRSRPLCWSLDSHVRTAGYMDIIVSS